MQVTLYDPKDPERLPPHRLADDALWPSQQAPSWEQERNHTRDPEHYVLYPCACCNWKDPWVKKARTKKLKVLNRFLKTGKLPPLKQSVCGQARTPRKMTDAEAARIVLPFPPLQYKTFAAGLTMQPGDYWIEKPCSRYLETMGEERSEGGDTWTCGCKVTNYEGGQSCNPCQRHRGAFEGTEDND